MSFSDVSRNESGPGGFAMRECLKLVFVIKSMAQAGGGAERVLADVTAELSRRGHEISIVSFDDAGEKDFYPVSDRVRRERMGIGRRSGRSRLLEVVRRVVALRRLISAQRPDVAVGFMLSSYIPLGLALWGTGIPVVASEHIDYRHWRQHRLQFGFIRASLSRYAAMTVLSGAVKRAYPDDVARIMVPITNPVSVASGGLADTVGGARKVMLSIGRLTKQKDHRTLIEAFARLASRHPDWDLRIVGEGELRGPLERQIARLNLSDRVFLPGTAEAIENEYRGAQFYVHPAEYESFGLVTGEALAHGLAAIGFADCPGTNELIEHGRNGLLANGADRVAALEGELDLLMGSAKARTSLGKVGPASVARFSVGAVADDWERLLQRVANDTAHRLEAESV